MDLLNNKLTKLNLEKVNTMTDELPPIPPTLTRQNAEVLEEKENLNISKMFWDDLKDSLELLETFSKDEIKDFVSNHMVEEVKEIQNQFEEDFKNIPDNDPFKFDVLCLLGKLGIEIYDKEEEKKRLQKIKEIEDEEKKIIRI